VENSDEISGYLLALFNIASSSHELITCKKYVSLVSLISRTRQQSAFDSRTPANGIRLRFTLPCFAPSEMSDCATSSPPADTATAAIDKAGEGVRPRWQPVRITGKNRATSGTINGRRMVTLPIANCPENTLRDGKQGRMFIVISLILDILQPQSRLRLHFLVQRDILRHESFLNVRTTPKLGTTAPNKETYATSLEGRNRVEHRLAVDFFNAGWDIFALSR
jgi:hypothetical protein